MIFTQGCKYTKNQRIVHFERLNSMVSELYFSQKEIMKRKKERKEGRKERSEERKEPLSISNQKGQGVEVLYQSTQQKLTPLQ